MIATLVFAACLCLVFVAAHLWSTRRAVELAMRLTQQHSVQTAALLERLAAQHQSHMSRSARLETRLLTMLRLFATGDLQIAVGPNEHESQVERYQTQTQTQTRNGTEEEQAADERLADILQQQGLTQPH